MSGIRNAVFGCAMTIASAIAPMGTAGAVPFAASDLKAEAAGDVIKVQTFCFGYGCDWERPRYYRPGPYYGHRRYYRPRYERPRYYGGYSAHVRWCLNRYRTYNPETDRYHAGRGIYRVCHSPYR